MRQWVVRPGLVLLVIAVLAILFYTVPDPLLHSPDRIPSTRYHNSPGVGLPAAAGSNVLLPLMGDVMEGPLQITLSLTADDLASARRDLEEYLERSNRFDSLVIELNLSSSDVEDFRRNNQQNLQDMQEIMNLTARFSELERLDITYRDQGNTELLYAISYEGEGIRARAVELSREYAAREQAVVTSVSPFELNTTGYQESVVTLSAIAEKVVIRQDERRTLLGEDPLPPSHNLSLTVQPTTLIYGETLTCNGELSGGGGLSVPITLYLDSNRIADIRTMENGRYRYSLPIQRIRAGPHLIYAAGDHSYSPIVPFTVRVSPTTLTIAARNEATGRTIISGALMAGMVPVVHAPVTITSDAPPLTVVDTNSSGQYYAAVNLSSGTHLLRGQFSSRDFPLLSSEAVLSYTPPDTAPGIVLPVLLPIGVLLASVTFATWYLFRRKSRRPITPVVSPLVDEPTEPPVSVPVTTPPAPDLESPADRARILFEEGRMQDAIVHLYRHLTIWMGSSQNILSFTTLTPREFAAAVGNRPFTPHLEEFTTRYEGLHYGGRPIGEEDLAALTTLVNEIKHASGSGED